ncbi:WRC protein [Senna tora]|uniref:WRC protein n=1 Tax=Senna tora TaxID=362788 RepID=A0A834SV97_9FABA|nr:WRC protein [Senna tora]
MEGSRCSRVNGRGWRCCQQTLVGYSLCEHHLGKGRLRSITSVKTNPIAPPPPSPSPSLLSISSPPYQKQTQSDGGDHQDHKEDAVVITKKRMKLGVVKARSISSLLGQTTTTQLPHNHNNLRQRGASFGSSLEEKVEGVIPGHGSIRA